MKVRDQILKSRLTAIFQALLVVFLWATSWIFIKIGLQDLPPLTFAGLRYTLAFLCLIPIYYFNPASKEIRCIARQKWPKLLLLGLVYYAITQGASFIALAFLPAVTVNLLWNFSSVTIALLGILWLSENPTGLQWIGILFTLAGAVIYFYPVAFPRSQWIGLTAAVVGVGANAVSSIMGRDLNRSKDLHPLTVTVVSMGAGSILLLGTGLVLEGMPIISWKGWLIILWLAVANTAFAFTLWNHTLRTLSAVESSIINSTMLIWIPIFAVLFLGETLSPKQILGLIAAGLGALAVQLKDLPGRKKDLPG